MFCLNNTQFSLLIKYLKLKKWDNIYLTRTYIERSISLVFAFYTEFFYIIIIDKIINKGKYALLSN